MKIDLVKFRETAGEFAVEEILASVRDRKIFKINTNAPVWKNSNFIDAIFDAKYFVISDSIRADYNEEVDTVYVMADSNENLLRLFREYKIEVIKFDDVTKDFLYKRYDDKIKSLEVYERVVNQSCVINTCFYDFFKFANLTPDVILDKISEMGKESLDAEDLEILNG